MKNTIRLFMLFYVVAMTFVVQADDSVSTLDDPQMNQVLEPIVITPRKAKTPVADIESNILEEVEITGTRLSTPSTDVTRTNSSIFNVDIELFPKYDADNAVDHTELLALGDRLGATGFIQVFRIQFGGKS